MSPTISGQVTFQAELFDGTGSLNAYVEHKEATMLLGMSAEEIITAEHEVVEGGGKNIEVAIMTKEYGQRQLEEAEIDAIVADIEEEKAAAWADKKAPSPKQI